MKTFLFWPLSCVAALSAMPVQAAYWSSYERLEWGSRNADSFYCLDILDSQGKMLRQAVACGEGLHAYSPRVLDLAPGDYRWKAWSASAREYGAAQPGFEGGFTIPAYYSAAARVTWGKRGNDTFYCVDVAQRTSEGLQILHRAAACGENLHTWSPLHVNLAPGSYEWFTWSASAQDHLNLGDSTNEGLHGWITVSAAGSSENLLEWQRRNGDAYYCLDIFDANGNMARQAAACGDGLHSYAPRDLNLPAGDYRWKAWSPSVKDYFGAQPGFEGGFRSSGCGLPYRSDATQVQWGCRDQDRLYCLDLFDANGASMAAPLICGEHMHSFFPQHLQSRNLPAGTYRWKAWSASARNYGAAQPGFEGEFYWQPPAPITPTANAEWQAEFPRAPIYSLDLDNNGELWLGTYGGVERRSRDGQLQQVIPASSGGLPYPAVTNAQMDGNGELWAGSLKGLAHRRADGSWEVFDSSNSPLPNYDIAGATPIRAVAADPRGGAWVATYAQSQGQALPPYQNLYNYPGHLFYYDGHGNWQAIDISASPLKDSFGASDTKLFFLAADGMGGVWIGGRSFYCNFRCYSAPDNEGGVAHYDGRGNWQLFTPANSAIPGYNVGGLSSDGNGGLWVAVNKYGSADRTAITPKHAIAHYQNGAWQTIELPWQQAWLGILAIAGNRDEAWIAMPGEGDNSYQIAHYNAQGQWNLLNRPDTGSPLTPTALITQVLAQGEQLWMGSRYDAIAWHDGQHWQRYGLASPLLDTEHSLPTQSISSLLPNLDGSLWGAAGLQLAYFDSSRVWRFQALPLQDSLGPSAKLAASQNGGLWFASQSELGLRTADGRIQAYYKAGESPLLRDISAFAGEPRGGVWLGNRAGEIQYTNGRDWQSTNLSDRLTPETPSIQSLAADGAALWAGAPGHLIWHDGKQEWRVLPLPTELANSADTPLSLLPDGVGGVWLGTNFSGLLHYDGRGQWFKWEGNPLNSLLSMNNINALSFYAAAVPLRNEQD